MLRCEAEYLEQVTGERFTAVAYGPGSSTDDEMVARADAVLLEREGVDPLTLVRTCEEITEVM